MNNNISKILKIMDNNFVDNYDDMLKYKNNLDEILIKLGLKKFKSYNEFCIMIRNNTINYLKDKKDLMNLENKFYSLIMNKTLKDKIKENKNYEKKIKLFLNTSKDITDIMKNEPNENNI